MKRKMPALASIVVTLVLRAAGLAAQSNSMGHSSHAPHDAADDPTLLDFTVNVGVSEAGIQPSTVFVPAGRPVQLVLRNRGTLEHHYRVIGLEAEGLSWLADNPDAADAVSGENHSHHGRTFVPARGTSAGGIRPSGHDVHAYVTQDRRVDEVLFTANHTGTYVARCDLHPGEVGRLVVFDALGPQVTASPSPSRSALTRGLTKDLGSVDYPGVSGVIVEATYAPAEYATQILGVASADSTLRPDQYVAILLSERVHAATLTGVAISPSLYVNGAPVPFISRTLVADSPHHRATVLRFARDAWFGKGHQMMTLRLASGVEATWHLPLVLPTAADDPQAADGFGDQWALILALLGGMLAAMWPCLFQLTVYFIPALAGVAMQNAGSESGRGQRRQVLTAAFYFILGFTLLYTATGALIGFAAQRLGDAGEFEVWQRYFGVAAGVVVIALALRVAAKVRAPLVCRMPVLSGMAHTKKPASRVEMMVAGLAFATGCMTCFGSALVVGMVVYVGLAQSAVFGAFVLFLFSLGMGIPLVIAAAAMAKALPLLMKLENLVPWMGLASAVLMAGFGTLLISGHYMVVSEWAFRAAAGAAALSAGHVVPTVVVSTAVLIGLLVWTMASGRVRRARSVNVGRA